MQHRENESITYGIQKTRRDTVAARHNTVLCTPTEITSGSDNIPLAVDCMLLSRHIYIFPSVFLTFSTKSLLLIRVKRSIKTAGMVVLTCRYSDVDRCSSCRTMRGARVKLLLHFFRGTLVRAYTLHEDFELIFINARVLSTSRYLRRVRVSIVVVIIVGLYSYCSDDLRIVQPAIQTRTNIGYIYNNITVIIMLYLQR